MRFKYDWCLLLIQTEICPTRYLNSFVLWNNKILLEVFTFPNLSSVVIVLIKLMNASAFFDLVLTNILLKQLSKSGLSVESLLTICSVTLKPMIGISIDSAVTKEGTLITLMSPWLSGILKSNSAHPLYGISVPFAATRFISVSVTRKSSIVLMGMSGNYWLISCPDITLTWAPVSHNISNCLLFSSPTTVHRFSTSQITCACCFGLMWLTNTLGSSPSPWPMSCCLLNLDSSRMAWHIFLWVFQCAFWHLSGQ